jgi:hypothetical protein
LRLDPSGNVLRPAFRFEIMDRRNTYIIDVHQDRLVSFRGNEATHRVATQIAAQLEPEGKGQLCGVLTDTDPNKVAKVCYTKRTRDDKLTIEKDTERVGCCWKHSRLGTGRGWNPQL